MVRPPPPPAAPYGVAIDPWVERVAGILGLAQGGVIVLIDRARIDHLRALVLALEASSGPVSVCLEPWEIEEVPHGATVVYEPLPSHARELNAARPLFSDRALKVVLWCSAETSAALARGAPDLFDWISHRVECPGGAPTFLLEGLRLAREAGAGGAVVVSDPDDGFDAALEGEAGVVVHHEGGDVTIADLRIADVIYPGAPFCAFVVDEYRHEPAWWSLDARTVDGLHGARAITGAWLSARALVGTRGEEAFLTTADQLAREGAAVDAALTEDALLELALSRGLVTREALDLWDAPAPLLRAAFATGEQRGAWARRRSEIAVGAPAAWQARFAPVLLARDRRAGPVGATLLLEAELRCEAPGQVLTVSEVIDATRLVEFELRSEVTRYVIGRAGRPASDQPALSLALLSLDLGDYRDALSVLRLSQAEWLDAPSLAHSTLRIRLLSAIGRYADAERVAAEAPVATYRDAASISARMEYLSERGRNAARWHRADIVEVVLDDMSAFSRNSSVAIPVAWTAPLVFAEHLLAGRAGVVDSAPLRVASGAFQETLAFAVLTASARWQLGLARSGFDLLRDHVPRPRALLHERAEYVVALARCATASGDAALAIEQATTILPDVERGLGAESHLAAQLHFERGEAHLAQGAYPRALAEYEAALATLRGGDLTDHPDRWIAELALSTLPSHTDLAAAEPAMERLAARLRAGHPLLKRWQERLDAARARAARGA